MKHFVIILPSIVFLTFLCIPISDCKLEPYKVLGVSRKASTQEIRKAYKNLAKEWHPDKNDDPKAQTKFVEINAAYEILGNTERRRKYDTHGIVDEQGSGRAPHPENFRTHFQRFHSPFEFFENDFFGGGGGGGHFHFGGGGGGGKILILFQTF